MRDELTAPPIERLRKRRDIPDDVAVDLGMELVNARTGPIVGFTERTPSPGESGAVFQYLSNIQKTARFSPNGLVDPDNTGGSAIDRHSAKIAALGEAIERYALSLSDPEDFLTATYADLDRPAVDPLEMNAFSDHQLDNHDLTHEDIRRSEYHWTMAREMTTGKNMLLPGQLIYLPFSSPTVIRSPSTTGAAAGMDYESAIYRSICEIVERESFIIGYLNEISFPKIDLSSIEDEAILAYRNELHNRGKEVHVLDISLDHPFHSSLAIAVDHDHRPSLSLGLNASVDMTAAVRGALRESLQISTWDAFDESYDGEPKDISTLEERAAFWASPDRIEDLSFWLETETTIGIQDPICKRPQAIDVALSYLEDRNYHWYVADVTTSDIRQYGFKTVSTVIPAFHPMHLIESFKYLGTDRLYDVPVEAGFKSTPTLEEKLNSMPHPFL